MKSRLEEDHIILITSSETGSQRSIFFYFLACIAVAVCFGSIISWYHFRKSHIHIDEVKIKNDFIKSVCTSVPNIEKFDCQPEGNASEFSCLQRGCCYEVVSHKIGDANFPPLNVPYCYYPKSYNGYSIVNISQDGRQIKATLKRNTISGFPQDIQCLMLVVTFIDDNTLRIKITDCNATRFEVPIPLHDDLKNLKAPSYNVVIDSNSGVFRIVRKSSGTIVFKTELSQLVYSNQFLQLSSYLPSPYLYGIGEHYGGFLRNMNWTRLTLFNADLEPIPNHNLYGSQPFYLSLEGDGNANGIFLLNSNAMDVILQPTPAITFRPIGGIFDLFVMMGPSPSAAIEQFTGLVGRTFMPPYWSLGFHLCRYGYNSLNKTREVMQRNIDAGIPLDVQWNDIDYMDRYKDFTYDKVNFDGLPLFVRELHDQGRHYVIMTDPGISNAEKPGSYSPYDEGLESDVFIKNDNGSIFIGKVWTDGYLVFPDFSHPNITSYWSKQFENFHNVIKFDGVWLDMNEPSNFLNGGIDGCSSSSYEDPPYLPGGKDKLRTKTVCMTAKHFKTIHYNEHNLMAYRESAATYEALKTIRGQRPFIISRATFSGQQIHSGHWSGDIASTWEDMRYTIPSMLNFNIYGMSMIGSDICGFNRNTTVELCARWQQLGAFYPFSRNHNERVTIEQDPVALGPVVVLASQKALVIRYYFLPYLYTLFYRSSVFGDTVVRPLFFEFPKDKISYHVDEQFMWGPALMIMPALFPGVSTVEVYVPEGVWYNNTGFPLKSGTLSAKITENINLGLRGGYIIPAQNPSLTTTESRKSFFVLIASLDENKKAIGELYWDDGDSLDTIKKGAYDLINFSISENVFQSTVVKKGYDTKMEIKGIQVLGVDSIPKSVAVNGVSCIKLEINAKTPSFNVFDASTVTGILQEPNFCQFAYYAQVRALVVAVDTASLLSPITIKWN